VEIPNLPHIDNVYKYTKLVPDIGWVLCSGSFTMSGGEISGNTAERNGGGVYVSSGNFTMSGGTISGNTSSSRFSSSSSSNAGGGVYVSSGNFTMSGGTISDNISSYGGGVAVYGGTFTMSDGTISGNKYANRGGGGGVYVGNKDFRGTFSMSNGTISGNTGRGVYVNSGTFSMKDGSISGNSYGGVRIPDEGIFTKTGGTIYGYSEGDANSNVVKDSSGAVRNYQGHAVWAGDTSRLLKITDKTAGPRDNLSYDGSKTPPTASGAWDNN